MIDLELLRSCGVIKKYSSDAVITLEGEKGQEMFFILSGRVGIFLNTFTDDAVKVTELITGEIFGEMSLLEDLPRSATVIALTPINVLVIDKDHFELFINRQPEMAFKIMKALSARLRAANNALLKSDTRLEKSLCTNEESIKVVQNIIVKSLFPDEHKTYDLVPKFDSSEYIFDKVVPCPICGAKFMTRGQKMSKLRSKGLDNDLRRRYENFDPLWYNIWTCPECYYSSYYHEFPSISPSKYKLVSDRIKNILNGEKPSIAKDANINQLFTQYYLLLSCALAIGVPNMKLGKIWMNLMWLYRDCEDVEMVKIASAAALKYYQEAYLKCDSNLKPEDEQQLCIILSELYIENDKVEEAFKYLMMARKQSGGSKTFSQMAEFRIDELKKDK
jgi:uncharacterized protein